jgi:malonyl-CoA decarboxylase
MEITSIASVRRKTVVNLLRTWRELTESARLKVTGKISPSVTKEDVEFLREQMRECLNSKGGEVSARARTVELGKTYLGLNDTGKARFLRVLAEDFDLDEENLKQKIEAWHTAKKEDEKTRAEHEMRDAIETPRSVILRQFNSLPNGFKFLVDLRSDLLAMASKEPALKGLEYDLKQLLTSWFDVGLLDLVEITWNSPASLLEKLITYEAVHKIVSWDDLKNRLDADRRVFAFLHNKMPNEPLIFVHVALVKGLSDNVQELLDQASPVMDIEDADTAIFYSISNAQKGLVGISFGNFLIKRVVDKITREMQQIKHFSTLSPIPGFRAWLDPVLAKGDDAIFTPQELREVKSIKAGGSSGALLLKEILDSTWHTDPKQTDKLKTVLVRLCAEYLMKEKKGKKAALDPVAHFHLTNGARLERINWLGDTSGKGLKQSAGLMVNYYYDLADIDQNHEKYATSGTIAASRAVKLLTK